MPSSERLPYAADQNKYRDPQSVTQSLRVRDLGVLSSNWDVPIKSHPSGLREICGRGGRKGVRTRGDEGH